MAKKQARKKPRFEVSASTKAWDIAKAGAAVSFEVKRPGVGKIGRLQVGQGSITWKPAHAKLKVIRVPWSAITDRLTPSKKK